MDNKNKVEEPAISYDGKEPITDISLLDFDKLYTYAHYLTWQFKERVELIKGRLFKMSPAPLVRHQRILGELYMPFANYLKGNPCLVFLAPFDVRFPKDKNDKYPYTVVQPDICVICDPNKLDEKGCHGAPDLIVEILSPSTSSKDTHEKFRLYEEFGVQEYWIVDPSNNLLDIFLLDENGKYTLLGKFDKTDTVPVSLFPDLFIELKEVFEE